MKLLRKKGILGSAGLTLVELLISMAILAVVGTAIGGAMYVSSRSYTRGSSEVNVQEEAQVSANLICDWLIDATAVTVNPAGTVMTITHPENGDEVEITVKTVGKNLEYSARNITTGATNNGILASYVEGATFTSTFDVDRNVKIAMDFKVNERTYHAVTDSTSRNHDFISTGGGTSGGNPIIGFNIPPVAGQYYVVLEPGQNDTHGAAFEFEATIYNPDPNPANNNLSISSSGPMDSNLTLTRVGTTNKWTVHAVSDDNARNDKTFTFTATKTLSDGTVLTDTKDVIVLIRRDTKCEFSVSEATPATGDKGKAGTAYNAVTLDLGITHPVRISAGAAYDSGSFGYKDPSVVQYFYRYSDGSDASSAVTATEVTSGDALSVQVTLNTELTRDLYVIAVAPHSGKLTASGANFNTSCAPANKVTSISGSDFTYTGVPAANAAYWDYFKIEKGSSGGGIPGVGAGFQRGSHAFRLGKLNDEAYNAVNAFMAANGGPTRFKHVVSFRYKKTTDSSWSSKVILSVRNGTNNANDWTIWGTEGTQGREYLTDMFDCDSAYDIYVQYDLIDTNTWSSVLQYHNSGTLNACDPWVYDQGTDKFIKSTTSTIGSASNPVVVDKNNGIPASWGGTMNNFYVYFDSLNVINNDPYKIGNEQTRVIEKYVGPTGGSHPTDADKSNPANWTTTGVKTPNVQGSQSLPFGSTTVINYNTVSVAHFDGSDDRYVGNFNQNAYPDIPVTVVSNECGAYQHSENGLYRISYKTNGTGKRAYISDNGAMPSASNPNGKDFSMTQYNITSPENLGTVYYEIKNF